MNKTLFSYCCIFSFCSCFSMNSEVSGFHAERNSLRSSVMSRINSIETNLDMIRNLSCDGIDKSKIETFIKDKNDEMNNLLNVLQESDTLLSLASKIDSSLEIASELRGTMDDAILDAYIDNMQREYENLLTKSCTILNN